MDYHQWTYSKCNNLSEMISHYWLLTIKKLSYHWLSWKLSITITISAISGSMAIDLFYINRKWTVTADGSRPSLGPRCWNLVMLSNGHCLFSFFFFICCKPSNLGVSHVKFRWPVFKTPNESCCSKLVDCWEWDSADSQFMDDGDDENPHFFLDSIILYNLHHLAIIYNRNIPTVWWYLAC